MNPELLLAHFNRISDAPDAIPRLRRFVLDLAVRGKLVEQHSSDEPASALLRRIQAEKARLVKEAGINRLEAFEPVAPNEIPFPIPSAWEAVRMGWLARKLGAGSTPLGGKSVYQKEGVPFLRSQNVHDGGLRLDDVALISRATHDRMSGTHIQQQDILLNITGASIGRCALVPDTFVEGNVSQHVAIIRLFLSAIREFIHLSLISPFFQKMIDDVQVGVSREGLSMQRLRLFPMLLPPLAEQYRIVIQVNELMALCDRLEAARDEQERRRDRLAAASLHHLNNGANAEAFRDHARFYLNHLPRLTTRPEHISEFRKTILNLAVRGQLVPQDPKDEPASELLKLVQAEKARLVREGKIKGHDPAPPLKNDDAPFLVPTGWRWVRFIEVAAIQSNLVNPKDYLNSPHIAPDNIESKTGRLLPYETIGESAVFSAKHLFFSGCILYSKIRPALAKAAIVDFDGLCSADMYPILPFVSREYLHKYMLSEPFVLQSISEDTRVAMPKINQLALAKIVVPVPPLAEQQRIVARVEGLMALCDRLEAQLTRATKDSHHLLESVLYHALNEGAEVESNPSIRSHSSRRI
jgi:type I restriction enzyme, S subunit